MNESLIRRWNETVGPDDDVYNLGDFVFQSNPDLVDALLSRLNGRHHLIYGNHDQVLKKHRGRLARHFVWTKDYHELRIDDHFVVLHHFPMAVWNKMHYGSIHLHGHCHGSYVERLGNKIVDVGIDSKHVTGRYDMRPFSFEEIRLCMSRRSFVPVDGHGRAGQPE